MKSEPPPPIRSGALFHPNGLGPPLGSEVREAHRKKFLDLLPGLTEVRPQPNLHNPGLRGYHYGFRSGLKSVRGGYFGGQLRYYWEAKFSRLFVLSRANWRQRNRHESVFSSDRPSEFLNTGCVSLAPPAFGAEDIDHHGSPSGGIPRPSNFNDVALCVLDAQGTHRLPDLEGSRSRRLVERGCKAPRSIDLEHV
jgi:hypothetical protein